MKLKKILFCIYVLLILVMAMATVIEKYKGTPFVVSSIYGSWWFSVLWAMLVAVGLVYIIQSKLRKWNIVLLHLSFVVILLGALLTHLTSYQGAVHLRLGQTTNEYLPMGDDMHNLSARQLPFSIQLNHFGISYHDGTSAVADYSSQITLIDGDERVAGTVSMNHIMSYQGVRLYQSSYDADGKGSILRVNSDPFGIPVTYVGYALLFFSLIAMLIDPKGRFRELLRSPLIQRGAFLVLLLLNASILPSSASTTTVFPKEVASRVGEMYVLYNNRVCQMQTFAYDFTKKISGKRSYKGCTPEQIFTGFIFWGDQWQKEKIIKVKGGELKRELGLDSYVSIADLFPSSGYVLRRLVEESYRDNHHDALHDQAIKLDEKVQLIVELKMGNILKLYPITHNGKTEWFSHQEIAYPKYVSSRDYRYMRKSFRHLYGSALIGNNTNVLQQVNEILAYQKHHAGTSLPTITQVKAERIYNQIPIATILFMFNLTIGFLGLFGVIRQLLSRNMCWLGLRYSVIESGMIIVLGLSFMVLTFSLVLRWIISGNVPLSNGYESMLSIAWFSMLITMLMAIRLHSLRMLITTFGFMLSGFFLLVSHISQMDPAIGQMMPVLNSPLLSVHVSVIMMSYAFLAIICICGLLAILLHVIASVKRETKNTIERQMKVLQVLSQIFLYPAITTLGLGIFIGAIWANVSWGTYWSWDPKETWALITLMIYALALHSKSVKALQKPLSYHIFMVLAFLSILMTYFGVNYILGGMHSYA